MNKKFFTSLVLVLVVLLVISGTTLAADLLAANNASTTPPAEHMHGTYAYEESVLLVTVNGKHYAMNPTNLPLFGDVPPGFSNAMNPTMLPDDMLVR